MAHASLGGVPLDIDPNSVSWNFQMKVRDRKTVGGKVIQVFGTSLGDMTVSGSFRTRLREVRHHGRTTYEHDEPWEMQEAFRVQVREWAATQEAQRNPATLRFLYPPKNWDFHVYLKGYTQPSGAPAIHHANDEIAPKWQLTLHIVQDNTKVVVKGIKDLYISRLMNGIGWKQTDYNGPTQEQVDDLLAGRSYGDYIREQFAQAATGAAANPDEPTGSAR